MSGPAPLEGGYRRLLALYPAEHRRAHEAEMLGVLMTGAHAGQRHPGFAESADLIWGALRIGLRPGSHCSPDPRWRDALAAVSVVLPLLALLYFTAHDLLGLAWIGPDNALLAATVQLDLQTLAWWLALTALVLLRLRRTAALAAAAMLIWYSVSYAGGTLNWGYLDPQWMLVLFALGLEIAALVTSPGPRRGLQILTRKHYALVAVVAVILGTALGWLWPSHQAASDAIMITGNSRQHGRDGGRLPAEQARHGPAISPRLLLHRRPRGAAVDGWRPVRLHVRLGWAAPDHADLPTARGRDRVSGHHDAPLHLPNRSR